MSTLTDRRAATDSPILDVLTDRWSTRIFDASAPIDEVALASALEAARWAPTAANTQPWRVIVARRGTRGARRRSSPPSPGSTAPGPETPPC